MPAAIATRIQSQRENWNIRAIRLLAISPPDGSPLFTDESDSAEDIECFASLLASGFIDGSELRNEVGRVDAIANMTLTIAGREYLEKLRKQESLNTSLGIIKEHRWRIYAWILSTIGSGAIGFIFGRLTK